MRQVYLEPYLTTSVINEMTCVGSLLIIGIGINMMFKNRISCYEFHTCRFTAHPAVPIHVK